MFGWRCNLRSLVLFVSLTAGSQFAMAGQVLFVDRDASGPNHDGSSWCEAFPDLQEALAEAKGSGGEVTEIRVGDGLVERRSQFERA